jgi:hypothetical protein
VKNKKPQVEIVHNPNQIPLPVNLCQKQAPHVQTATQQTDANRDKRERLNMGVSSRQEVLDIVYDAGAEGETTPAS